MKLSLLRRTHPDYRPEVIALHGDLFAGGAQIRERMASYIPRHDVEPHETYRRRVKAATYLNYCAPIVNGFASALLASPPTVRMAGGEDPPEWSLRLKERATPRQDLETFARDRLVEALVHGRSWWRVKAPDRPDGLTRAEFEREYEALEFCPVPVAEVTHWACGDDGRFLWVLEHRAYLELERFDQDEKRVEEWTLFEADVPPRRWRLVTDPAKPAADAVDVPEVEIEDLPLVPGVPHVAIVLPPELWVVNLVADAQLELLRKRCALSWAIDRVCFAMPVLFTATKKPVSVMGAGYFLQLGREDRMEYPAPPSTPFDVIGQYIVALKDEMYRVVAQMAAGVENNAAAIGRSGESKIADGALTEIVLRALGLMVRDALERAFELGSVLLGTPLDFRLGGLDTFQVTSARDLFELASGVEKLAARSPSLDRELLLRLARRALPDAPAEILAAIEQELAATSSPPTAPMPGAARTSPPTTGGEGS